MEKVTAHTDISDSSPLDHEAEVKALKKRNRQRRRVKRHQAYMRILTGFMVAVVGIYCAVGWFGLTYAKRLLSDMPELRINDFISPESSKIYDGNGQLITEIGTYYRDNITYSQCPEALVDAFLSIEDSRYFEHTGFDIPRFSKEITAINTIGIHLIALHGTSHIRNHFAQLLCRLQTNPPCIINVSQYIRRCTQTIYLFQRTVSGNLKYLQYNLIRTDINRCKQFHT